MKSLIGLGVLMLDKILTVAVVCGLLALFVAYPLPTAILIGAVIIGATIASRR